MKLIIDVEKEYYEMLKYNVKHGQNYKPFEIIANGVPYDKVIDEVTELLENEWGYEGMREEVSKLLRENGTPYNPTGDCISREALKEQAIWTKVNNGVELIDIEVVPLDAIDKAQAVETKRPQGEWLFKHNSSDIWCSVCDENFDETPQAFNFCPNCGATMRTEDK